MNEFEACGKRFVVPDPDGAYTLVAWSVNQQEIAAILPSGEIKIRNKKMDNVDLSVPGTAPALILNLRYVHSVRRCTAKDIASFGHICVISEDGSAKMCIYTQDEQIIKSLKPTWVPIDLSKYVTQKFLRTEFRKLSKRIF